MILGRLESVKRNYPRVIELPREYKERERYGIHSEARFSGATSAGPCQMRSRVVRIAPPTNPETEDTTYKAAVWCEEVL